MRPRRTGRCRLPADAGAIMQDCIWQHAAADVLSARPSSNRPCATSTAEWRRQTKLRSQPDLRRE